MAGAWWAGALDTHMCGIGPIGARQTRTLKGAMSIGEKRLTDCSALRVACHCCPDMFISSSVVLSATLSAFLFYCGRSSQTGRNYSGHWGFMFPYG